jgi:spore maturation protein SpmA
MNNWIWIGKFLIVIAAALVLGEVLGSLELFRSATFGSAKVTAGSLVRFFAHAGALVLMWLLGQRLAQQIRALGGGMARLADPVLALITLIVTASAYVVLIKFSAPFLGEGVRTLLDWTFILGILAAAVWLVWTLFQNSEAVMEAIGKSGKAKTG